MWKKIESWCYGGKSKAFFVAQNKTMNQYNSMMLDRLLLVMTVIIGAYFAMSLFLELFSKYTNVYFACLVALLLLLCTFKLKVDKSIAFIQIYIVLFAMVLFTFVCVLDTICEPNTEATMMIVYLLVLPMLFIVPMHHAWGVSAVSTCLFSIAALMVKDLQYAQIDIAQSITCLVIGVFIGRHILASRIALYAANEQLESDIYNRKQEQEELRLRLEQHQIIMNQTTDILFEWNIRNDILNVSANWQKKFGYAAIGDEISQRIPLSSNIHTDDMPAFVKIMKDTAAGKPYSEAEFRIKDSKGRYRWCRIRATAQFDSAGSAVKAVGVILDINAEKKEKQDLLKMAQRDTLTGIYNKAATNALVARRMEDFDFTVLQALLMIDIDYFKTVNDTYGHMTGDNILAAVAAQLKTRVRSSDVVGRIGGDEFLVYLTEIETEEAALWKAQSLHTALGTIAPAQGAPPITCSIGMAIFPHGAVKYSDLYRCADTALYQRKESGRNGVSVYDKDRSASSGAQRDESLNPVNP